MSGAPVVAAGCLLGVVTEHAAREGSGTITVTPLTALEPDPAHPGWGAGVPDPAAWWARLGVAGLAALRRLPPRRVRPQPAYRATVREIQTRTRELRGPRARVERDRRVRHIARRDTGGWLVGRGRARRRCWRRRSRRRPTRSTLSAISCRVARQTPTATGFSAPWCRNLPTSSMRIRPSPTRYQFRAFGTRPARAVAAAERHLLLVVDGLDEDLHPAGSPSVAALLPTEAGGRAHVLVSSRPYPELPSDVPVEHPLQAITADTA